MTLYNLALQVPTNEAPGALMALHLHNVTAIYRPVENRDRLAIDCPGKSTDTTVLGNVKEEHVMGCPLVSL